MESEDYYEICTFLYHPSSDHPLTPPTPLIVGPSIATAGYFAVDAMYWQVAQLHARRSKPLAE